MRDESLIANIAVSQLLGTQKRLYYHTLLHLWHLEYQYRHLPRKHLRQSNRDRCQSCR